MDNINKINDVNDIYKCAYIERERVCIRHRTRPRIDNEMLLRYEFYKYYKYYKCKK